MAGGEVDGMPLEIRHFRVSPYSEEAELAPSWAAGAARNGEVDEEGSKVGDWV